MPRATPPDAAGAGVGGGRGRVDKRRAILDAALAVFARDGYAQANLDVVAAEAGVAKPTIYNHMGDKAGLFRAVIVEAAQRTSAATLAALRAFPTGPVDDDELRRRLTAVADGIVGCMADPGAAAVRRLLAAEAARFPDLLDAARAAGPDDLVTALAGHLARLGAHGSLAVPDPERAARQFIALVTGDLLLATTLSGAAVDDATRAAAVTDGVDTFLRAFAPPTRQPR